MKRLITELNQFNVDIQQRNLLLFQPWNTPRFHYINPFASYSKSTPTPIVFQQVFAYHRTSTVQQGFRYSILLAAEPRWERVGGQRGTVGDDLSAANSSTIENEAHHPASYFYDLTEIMESGVG
ncbi:hypothetical protein TNCV_3349801 [Trichonephila clavipes]|nr:hypothetical protein TNCV_3349801 [Trichonephila clavipes]